MSGLPEPDRAAGAPHPREATRLFGQDAAEAEFLRAWDGGRLHHGWLITGPRGVGKATLAWRIANFVLSRDGDVQDDAAGPGFDLGPPQPATPTLDPDPDHPVNRRLRALSEPRLFLLRRPVDPKTERLRQEITVDEVRRLKSFFTLSSAGGGRRVVIVDAADEMNRSAANALLKLLEEPPEGAMILLVSHQPSRLLPTIRSRCRVLRCAPLDAGAMTAALEAAGVVPDDPAALAELATGSVGDAVRLCQLDGQKLYAGLVELLSGLPRLDRARALALAETAAARGAEERRAMILHLFDLLLARLARSGASGRPLPEAAPGEAALFARLAPTPEAARRWADLAQSLSARASHAQAVNLDPAALILDMVFRIDRTAATQPA